MTKEEIEHAVIKNTIRTLCVTCAGDEDKVIDMLTGYLWDEEEAGDIKRSDGRFDIVRDLEQSMENNTSN